MQLLTHECAPLAESNGVSPILVFGNDRWNVFELRSRLGIVSAALHDGFVRGNCTGQISGLDAVLSGLFASKGTFNHHIVTQAMRRQAADALALMGASLLADKRLGEMSTGEARRVLIARALVTTPEALVLDEPTKGLDLVARHGFMERVRRIARQGTTLLLVTHHIEEIIPEVERVILFDRGRIAADGPKDAILTPDSLGRVFDAKIALERANGYYHVRLEGSER